MDRKRLLALLPALVFAAAVVPRAAYLWQLRSSPTYLAPEGGDSILYDRVAQGEREPHAYFHSPLYQWFLSGLYGAFGRNLTAVRVLQLLLGALTAALVYLLTLQIFGRASIALVAGLAQAIYGPSLFLEGQLLVDGLMPLLLVLVALAMLAYQKSPGLVRAAIMGLALGVGALGRPVVLAFAAVALAAVVVAARADRRRWLDTGAAAVAVAVAVFPATLRNWQVEHDLVLITANGGLNLYVGNNPNATGTYNLPEGLWFRPGDPEDDYRGSEAARRETGRTLASSELSWWWTGKALRWLAANPGSALSLVGRKVFLLLNNFELPQLYDFYAYQEIAPALKGTLGSGPVVALGLAGLVFALAWARRRETWIAAALAVCYAASFLPFFVVDRYRAPWICLLAPFAAWAAVSLVDLVRERRPARAAALGLAVVALAVVCFLPAGVATSRGPQYFLFGQARMVAGDVKNALRWYGRAAAASPEDARVHANLGIALGAAGRLDEAVTELERAVELSPAGAARFHNNLGLLHRRRGDAHAAEASFREAIRDEPALAEAWANLGDLLAQQGDAAGAVAAFRSARTLAPEGAAWIEAVDQRIRNLEESLGGKPSP